MNGVNARNTYHRRYLTLSDRFWSFADRTDDSACWLWKGGKDACGYGIFNVGSRKDGSRRPIGSHVMAYNLLVGEVPAGLELDHLCRIRSCCNPTHLEPVTHRENILRGEGRYNLNSNRAREALRRQRASITHCPHGHNYTKENTAINIRGAKYCRTCARAYAARRWQRMKEMSK